jgi:hypothetical protein
LWNALVRVDPVSKFHRVTGTAASLLVELEQLGRRRVDLQRRVREMADRASGRLRPRDDVSGPLDELRRQVSVIEAAERDVLDRYRQEAQRETTLRDALVKRGLL